MCVSVHFVFLCRWQRGVYYDPKEVNLGDVRKVVELPAAPGHRQPGKAPCLMEFGAEEEESPPVFRYLRLPCSRGASPEQYYRLFRDVRTSFSCLSLCPLSVERDLLTRVFIRVLFPRFLAFGVFMFLCTWTCDSTPLSLFFGWIWGMYSDNQLGAGRRPRQPHCCALHTWSQSHWLVRSFLLPSIRFKLTNHSLVFIPVCPPIGFCNHACL